mgnify:CR=1 FL=1
MNKFIVAFSLGLLMALSIIAFFLVGMNIGSNMDSYYSPAPEMAIELECPEGNIESRASCFIDYVYGFHNYQQSTDFYMKSLEKLKKEGGDCLNYALLYKELAIKHGYKAKVVSLLDGYYGHAVTIMYDKSGYCIMDILYKFCMAL